MGVSRDHGSCNAAAHAALKSSYEAFVAATEALGITEIRLRCVHWVVELRNCRRCGSTLGWRVGDPPAPVPDES